MLLNLIAVRVWSPDRRRYGVEIRKPGETAPCARYSWHNVQRPRKGRKVIVHNCYRWALHWSGDQCRNVPGLN